MQDRKLSADEARRFSSDADRLHAATRAYNAAWKTGKSLRTIDRQLDAVEVCERQMRAWHDYIGRRACIAPWSDAA